MRWGGVVCEEVWTRLVSGRDRRESDGGGGRRVPDMDEGVWVSGRGWVSRELEMSNDQPDRPVSQPVSERVCA